MTRYEDQLRGFHAAITGAAPLESAAALIDGDDALVRLRVYAHAYVSRIAGALVHDYPKLDALLGSIRPLAAPYLRAHPPSHPSMREVGARLPAFLAARGEPAHVVDLAALERARAEAFDGGADATPLTRDDVAARAPDAFPSLPLRLVPSSRVVTMTSNADAIWDALESAAAPPAPAAAARTVLVWRRDVTVVHRTLDADEARVLPALAAGTTFGDVCDQLADADDPTGRALTLLLRWLDAAILAA